MQTEKLRNIFLVVGMICVVQSFFLKKLILKFPVTPVSSPVPAETLIGRLAFSTIVAQALCESTVILGLISVIATRQFNDYFPFAVISLIGILSHLPRLERWEDWMRTQLQNLLR